MNDNSGGYGPPKLEGYSVEHAPRVKMGVARAVEGTAREISVTLTGEGFMDRAMPLIITIGDIWVMKYQIALDGRSVVCFLDEIPEEGAVISAGYGGEKRVELPERFSLSLVPGGDQT